MKSYVDIKQKIEENKRLYFKSVPHVVIFYVISDDQADLSVTHECEILQYIGMNVTIEPVLDCANLQDNLALVVWRAGQNKDVDVIIVQTPLPREVDLDYILKQIPPEKNFDSLMNKLLQH